MNDDFNPIEAMGELVLTTLRITAAFLIVGIFIESIW